MVAWFTYFDHYRGRSERRAGELLFCSIWYVEGGKVQKDCLSTNMHTHIDTYTCKHIRKGEDMV